MFDDDLGGIRLGGAPRLSEASRVSVFWVIWRRVLHRGVAARRVRISASAIRPPSETLQKEPPEAKHHQTSIVPPDGSDQAITQRQLTRR